MQDYIKINQKLWDDKTPYHVNSDFYDIESFLNGRNSLNSIELELLGDVAGKSLLHLQCHFGQDTLSLARMGAQVTGIDLSSTSIHAALELAAKIQMDANFVNCDVYSVPKTINTEFDVVFTSYGTIGWLPNMQQWAQVVYDSLKPGGEFIFAEFHPIVWMFDTKFKKIDYAYFNHGEIVEEYTGTYTDFSAPIQNKAVNWNHHLSEVIDALLQTGLHITTFKEFDYSPYNCFENTIESEPGKFQIKNLQGMIPMVYALKAVKT